MKKFPIAIPLAALVSILVASSADGQEGFEASYGNGVHQFFNGQYQKAYDSFTTAMSENQRDPRVYYFRGLAAQNLGIGGTGDFQVGAQLEAENGGRSELVNEALERIQGHARISLESARSEAILASNQRGSRAEPVIPVRRRTYPIGDSPGGSGSSTRSGPVLDRNIENRNIEISPIVPGQEFESNFPSDDGSDSKNAAPGSGSRTSVPDNGFGDFPLDNEPSTPDNAIPFGGSDGSGSQNPVPSASGSKTGVPDNGFPLDNEPSTPDTANPFGGSDGSGSQNPVPSASGSRTGVPDNGFGDFPLDNETSTPDLSLIHI